MDIKNGDVVEHTLKGHKNPRTGTVSRIVGRYALVDFGGHSEDPERVHVADLKVIASPLDGPEDEEEPAPLEFQIGQLVTYQPHKEATEILADINPGDGGTIELVDVPGHGCRVRFGKAGTFSVPFNDLEIVAPKRAVPTTMFKEGDKVVLSGDPSYTGQIVCSNQNGTFVVKWAAGDSTSEEPWDIEHVVQLEPLLPDPSTPSAPCGGLFIGQTVRVKSSSETGKISSFGRGGNTAMVNGSEVSIGNLVPYIEAIAPPDPDQADDTTYGFDAPLESGFGLSKTDTPAAYSEKIDAPDEYIIGHIVGDQPYYVGKAIESLIDDRLDQAVEYLQREIARRGHD